MSFALYTPSANLLPTEVALRRAVSALSDLAEDTDFLASHVLPLMEKQAEDWYVAHREDSPDGSTSLQVFVWPPGSATEIHDHSSWGTFRCVVGSIREERYERTDDGSTPDHACLTKAWQLQWRKEDGTSTVLPYEGGIHRVGNTTARLSISVHLYGPRLGEIDGRDYDLSRDYVCDRRED